MDEQMIAAIAKALVSSDGVIVDCAGMAPYLRRAEAAHSVIAGKVAELTEALIEARSAIATWSETPCEHDYKKHDALCYIDAALAPYPERRHE